MAATFSTETSTFASLTAAIVRTVSRATGFALEAVSVRIPQIDCADACSEFLVLTDSKGAVHANYSLSVDCERESIEVSKLKGLETVAQLQDGISQAFG